VFGGSVEYVLKDTDFTHQVKVCVAAGAAKSAVDARKKEEEEDYQQRACMHVASDADV